MSKQVVFVVTVDLDTKQVFIDDDLLVARFASHEQVWDTATQKWEADDEEATLYQEALNILNTTLPTKDGN
jgi:hypothetical protein